MRDDEVCRLKHHGSPALRYHQHETQGEEEYEDSTAACIKNHQLG